MSSVLQAELTSLVILMLHSYSGNEDNILNRMLERLCFTIQGWFVLLQNHEPQSHESLEIVGANTHVATL